MTSEQRTELQTCLSTARKSVNNVYAQAYLDRSAFSMAEEMGGDTAISVQILYCLNNMSGWKGPEARDCKARLKKLANDLRMHL